MNKYILILISFIISTINCLSAWENFPCPTNTTFYSVQNNKYISQLFTGLIERCEAVNVPNPIIVDTLTGYAGWSNAVEDIGYFTNGWYWACDPPEISPYEEGWEEWMWDCWQYYDNEWVHVKYATNKILIYTNIVVTNQFDAFTYNYSSPEQSGTETIYPPIRASWFTAFDNKLREVINHGSTPNSHGYWIDTNMFFNGDATYGETYCRSRPSAYDLETNNSWKIRGMGKLCYIGGFGTWENTNSTFTIDSPNTDGYFTHRPSIKTNEWVLGTIIYKKSPIRDIYNNIIGWTTNWNYNQMGPMTLNLIDRSVRPVFEYKPAGTNPFTSSITFSIGATMYELSKELKWNNSGLAGVDPNQSYTEDIIVNSIGDTACASPIYSIANITASGTPPNVDDAWRVVYKCDFPVYANNDVYRLYANDINERQKALNLLTHTYQDGRLSSTEWWWGSGDDADLNTAKNEAISSFTKGAFLRSDMGVGVYYDYDPLAWYINIFKISGGNLLGTNWNISAATIINNKKLAIPTNRIIKVTQYVSLAAAGYIGIGFSSFDKAYTNDAFWAGKVIFNNYGLTTASGGDYSYDRMLPMCQWTSLGGTPIGQGLRDFGVYDANQLVAPYVDGKTVGYCPDRDMIIVDNTTWFTKK